MLLYKKSLLMTFGTTYVAAALQDCTDLRLSIEMFIQVALTVILWRNQVQNVALRPA